MSKGDTTIRIDMEVAGASSVKMTAADVFKSLESGSKKATSTEAAEAKKRLADAKAAKKEEVRLARRAEDDKRWAQREAAREEKWLNHEALREKKRLEIRAEEDKRRSIRETAAETKRIAREQERDSKRRMREEARDAKMLAKQRGMMGSLGGRAMWAGAMGIAGYAGVAGVSGLLQQGGQTLGSFADKRTELERTITPLASIGDNVNNLAAVRREVIGISAVTGIGADGVAEFLNNLESSTGNLEPDVVRDLKNEIVELTKVKGGSIGEMGEMMVSAWQIAGKELENVNQLQNKIAFTEEIGKAKIGELARYMPTILNMGDLLDISMDETLGTIAGGSLKTGDVQKLMTGLRNFLLIMETAPSKGVQLTGTYVEKLEQMKGLFETNRNGMIDLFDREVVDSAYQIVSQVDLVKEKIGELQNMPATGDIVGDKLKLRLEDTISQAAMLNTLYKTLIEQSANLTKDGDMTNRMYKVHQRMQQAELGGKAMSGGSELGGLVGKTAALFGFNKMTEVGVDRALDVTPPGPERDLLLRQQFELDKESDLNKLHGTNELAKSKWGDLFGQDWDSDRIKEIKSREFDPEEARKKNPYQEQPIAMASKEAQDLVDALNRNTQATIENNRTTTINLKPGGGKANAEETL
jgi:hypothetical protein